MAALQEQMAQCYQKAYGNEPFVRILEGKALPDTKNVTGTNMIEIAWRLDARTGRLIVMSAIDNIVKGASGQAVQSMNILCGFPETAGFDLERQPCQLMDIAANLTECSATSRRRLRPVGTRSFLRHAGHRQQRPPGGCGAARRRIWGCRLFGENRVQEAKIKIGQCPSRLQWHLIGHLQSNKCRDAVHFFRMIQSVDSLALAREINKWAGQIGQNHAHSAGGQRRGGIEQIRLLAGKPAVRNSREINALPKIEVHGLMTVAPLDAGAGKGAAGIPAVGRD